MTDTGSEVSRKRIRTTEGSEGNEGGGATMEEDEAVGQATETAPRSEEMESDINRILEKINHFTKKVSDLLEAGRKMLKDLGDDFEERLVAIHKEQMEKWEQEIEELRLLDASNAEAKAMLQNAQLHILQTISKNP